MVSESGEQGNMVAIGEDKGGDGKQQKRETNGDRKGRSCSGYLYYTNSLKTNNRNPRCIGIPRSLPHVPRYAIERPEIQQFKEGKALVGFYYACVGYSVHSTKIESSADKEQTSTELPACVGLELLVDRRLPSTDTAPPTASAHPPSSAHVPTSAHAHNKEDRQNRQPQNNKPTQPTGTDFASRFTRNAKLVASAVVRDMRRVGNHVKDSIDDMLDPYRKRPR